jgi:hypothetical protein
MSKSVVFSGGVIENIRNRIKNKEIKINKIIEISLYVSISYILTFLITL